MMRVAVKKAVASPALSNDRVVSVIRRAFPIPISSVAKLAC